MDCDAIRSAMRGFDDCHPTADGARIATHCLYPSFEVVHVFVVREHDTFTVHDDGGAFHAAWSHGRDVKGITKVLANEAERRKLSLCDNRIIAAKISPDWLRSAILTVANASASAASAIIAKSTSQSDEALISKIDRMLTSRVAQARIARGFTLKGSSGGDRHFDFAVRRDEGYNLLISGVTSHHSSYFAKYVAFSDVDTVVEHKLAVRDGALKTDVEALMQKVAFIVPLTALSSMPEMEGLRSGLLQ